MWRCSSDTGGRPSASCTVAGSSPPPGVAGKDGCGGAGVTLLEEVAAGLWQGRPGQAHVGRLAQLTRLHTADVIAAFLPQVAEEAGLLRGRVLGLHQGEVLAVLMKITKSLTGDFVVCVVTGQKIRHVG